MNRFAPTWRARRWISRCSFGGAGTTFPARAPLEWTTARSAESLHAQSQKPPRPVATGRGGLASPDRLARGAGGQPPTGHLITGVVEKSSDVGLIFGFAHAH